MTLSTPADRIRAGTGRLAVVGLGYAGLPVAIAFLDAGFRVIGYDLDPARVQALSEGRSFCGHVPSSAVGPHVQAGRLQVTGAPNALGEVDAALVCVPTPLTPNRTPDLGAVCLAAEEVAPHLARGALFVLESTTYPGTTLEVVRPILEERSGLSAGRDLHLAFSPEREDPGSRQHTLSKIPKVVGGLTPRCLEVAAALYGHVAPQVVRASSLQAAEATKLFENCFRAVNIAFVNEMKVLFDRMGLDIWEVIELAKTKPFGFMPFYPGPGLGGHCIPIDPFYLTWRARAFGLATRFLELAGEVNTEMPGYVVRRLTDALNDAGKPVRGARILLLGAAYKKNVDDTRGSPAFAILQRLHARGARLSYHDPHVPHLAAAKSGLPFDLESVPLEPAELQALDAAVLVTDHRAIDYDAVRLHAPLVIDTRHAFAREEGGAQPGASIVPA